MKRYRFPLAGVQRWRAHGERTARRQLGAALAELGRIEQRLEAVRSNRAACGDAEHGDASELARALDGGLRHVEGRLVEMQGYATAAVDQAREAYTVRRRDLRVIERLEHKAREDWRRDVLADEQLETEELVRMRAHGAGRRTGS